MVDEQKFSELRCSVVRCLGRIFVMERESGIETECVVDNNNICLCIGKSEFGKRCLEGFGRIIPKPDLLSDGWQKHFVGRGDSSYDAEYMKKVVDVLEFSTRLDDCEEKKVCLTVGKDSPIFCENKHFVFVLAPRIDSD